MTAEIIREAKEKDLNEVWRLWKEIQDQKVYFAYDPSYTKEQIENIWINLTNHIYVMEIENNIVGAYLMKPNQPGFGNHVVNAAYLVDAKVRGKGIGHKLCKHSIDTAKNLGYRGMQYNLVVSTNRNAMTVWESFGFKIIGTIPGGFRHVEKGYVDAYIYFKDLSET